VTYYAPKSDKQWKRHKLITRTGAEN